MTHRVPEDAARWRTITFADSVQEAVDQAGQIAGDRNVTISRVNIAQQALELGLVDEVDVSLAPVLLGEGIPYFAHLARAPYRFDDPVVVEGSRATHLRFQVRRG